MSAKTRDLGMTPLDDLFSTDESRAEAQLEKVATLNPAKISDFPKHPFKVKQDDAMAELTEISCIVRNLTDDEATIIMADSNFQRETILPSEKAFAYKMKLAL